MGTFFNRMALLNCCGGSTDSCEELLPLNVPIGNWEPVVLNVYDLFSYNAFAVPLGLGVFHTGVQVYNVEFTYGGHIYSNSGIFELPPRSAEEELGEHFRYRESIDLGHTHYSREEVYRIVEQLGWSFTGNCYHLTSNNCNHFSDAMTRRLCGRPIPNWINRLAYIVGCVPFLERCLPPEWLSPI